MGENLSNCEKKIVITTYQQYVVNVPVCDLNTVINKEDTHIINYPGNCIFAEYINNNYYSQNLPVDNPNSLVVIENMLELDNKFNQDLTIDKNITTNELLNVDASTNYEESSFSEANTNNGLVSESVTTTLKKNILAGSEEKNIEEADNNKENEFENSNKKAVSSKNNIFTKSFTLPLKYLTKKKRVKIEATKKPKLPAAITSTEWLDHHMQKEKEKEVKEEKLRQKKQLQSEKKKLAEQKKELQLKINEILV